MPIIHHPFPRVASYDAPTQMDIEVTQESWRTTDSGILVAENLSPAMFLAAHNRDTKRGLLAYFTDPNGDPAPPPGAPADYKTGRQVFDEALPAALELGPPGSTCVALGGGALHDEWGTTPEDMRAQREYATERVHELAPPLGGVALAWTPESVDFAHVQLNAANGLVTVEYGMLRSGPAQ